MPDTAPNPTDPTDALADLWQLAGLPPAALGHLTLTGHEPVFPSSFAVGTAAQVTEAAAALAACEVAHLRGAPRRHVTVDMLDAAVEATGHFTLDGRTPDLWDPFAGLYACSDGAVRVHTNFRHHRDGALRLLGLDPATATRDDMARALKEWKAVDFETVASGRGLVATALRTFAQWDATPQGRAVASQPLMRITRIGDGPAPTDASVWPSNASVPPLPLPPLAAAALPLAGIRVLDLTRILAGPVGGRTLAVLGADVLLVNSPYLPNIAAIAETSRGKRSALIDLRRAAGRETLWRLVDDAHVFSQGYRPGGLGDLGFTPEALAARRPGIVVASLTAYGTEGPWADRRGFDSLVQTAMGFNVAEGEAARDAGGDGKPRALPMQILDQATGFLIAFGASAALWRQQREGGSWHVEVSLAQTGYWLRGLGRVGDGLEAKAPEPDRWLVDAESAFGNLRATRSAMNLARDGSCSLQPDA